MYKIASHSHMTAGVLIQSQTYFFFEDKVLGSILFPVIFIHRVLMIIIIDIVPDNVFEQ